MRCLHCHGGEALQTDGHSLARDRCYYCQHSKYGNGRMECEKCQVGGSAPFRTFLFLLLLNFILIVDLAFNNVKPKDWYFVLD